MTSNIVIPAIAWTDLMPQLNTGDLLSFAGNAPLDWAIQFVEGAPYTHVGIVIRDGTDLWFWDAPGGGDTFPDPVSKNPNQPGARVADLETVISYYMTSGGEVAMWWRQLQPAVTPEQQACLMTFVELADGTPFPGTNFKLPAPWNMGVGFGAGWALGTTLHATIAGTFFCAQLAAQSYMSMGMLPIWPRPANAYDPAIFNSNDSETLPLIGVTMSAAQPVTYTPSGVAAPSTAPASALHTQGTAAATPIP
jgi:hypothetical protein